MLFMGIDVGTQGVRCVVAGEDGSLAAAHSVPFSQLNIAQTPGWYEQSPEAWVEAAERAIQVCTSQLGSPEEIAAVSVDGTSGPIAAARPGLNPAKASIAAVTNKTGLTGTLADALKGADAVIGVSAPGLLTADMVRTMARDAIVFACANPTPEIFPDEAKKNGAAVAATGRSDLPNQLNNVLAFPGVFRGALDVRASDINRDMKVAAAHALAALVSEDELSADYIIPKPFDPRVRDAVAAAVARAARDSGVARI